MATQPIDARVIKLPHGFKVVPADVFKRAGNTFRLANLTSSIVHVSFSRELQMQPAEGDINPGTLEAFTIGDPRPGAYEYFVEVRLGAEDLTLRARGGSDPQIIIDF